MDLKVSVVYFYIIIIIVVVTIISLVRLTPPYAFLIFFYATMLSRLGSGPLWNQWVGRNRDYCVANWWTNLLYINNYINVQEMVISIVASAG
jgi:hypothetical protein